MTETTLNSTSSLPPIGRSRSFLTCSQQYECGDLSTSPPSLEKENASRSASNIGEDADAEAVNDAVSNDEDDDDSEELRALASAAAGQDGTDDSADEVIEVSEDGGDSIGGKSSDHPGQQLSSSSASVLGRIAAGFTTAVSGGLHPLKRSQRVGPEVPSPRSPSPKEFFWGPVMPGYPTSPPEADETKAGQSTMVIRQTVQMEQTQTSNNSEGDTGLRQAIPVMPTFLAVACCILNIISPGLGKPQEL